MFEVRNGIKYLIFVYLGISLLLWYYKPAIIFDNNKTKIFGTGYKKTVFSYHIVIIFLAIILFYIFEVIKKKKNNFL